MDDLTKAWAIEMLSFSMVVTEMTNFDVVFEYDGINQLASLNICEKGTKDFSNSQNIYLSGSLFDEEKLEEQLDYLKSYL